jgi:hypothetical protein
MDSRKTEEEQPASTQAKLASNQRREEESAHSFEARPSSLT